MNNNENSTELQDFRLRLGMMCDYWGAAAPGGTGSYWRVYEKEIRRQVEIEAGDVMSHKWSAARSFSGGADFPPVFFRQKLTRPIRLMHSLLRRTPNPLGMLNPLWRLLYILLRWLDEVPIFGFQTKLLLEYGEALFKNELDQYGISSPEIMANERVKLISGRWLSYATLRNFNMFLCIIKRAQHYPVVLEIGGGIGELARIFVATGTADRYVIVDIPPALAFSERFLEKALGSQVIDHFDPKRTELNLSRKVHFLTPNQLHLVGRFDLGINIASFGEMTRPIVESYVKTLKNSGFKEFVSMNQRIQKTGNSEIIGEKEYVQWFGPEFQVKEKGSFRTDCPIMSLIPDVPGERGYQFLRFGAA